MGAADSPPGSEGSVDEKLRRAARWAQRFSSRSDDRLPAVEADEEHCASLSAGKNLTAMELEKGTDGTYALYVGGAQESGD